MLFYTGVISEGFLTCNILKVRVNVHAKSCENTVYKKVIYESFWRWEIKNRLSLRSCRKGWESLPNKNYGFREILMDKELIHN